MNNEGKDATLSREQVERYYAEVTSPDELGITDPRMKAVFDMALRAESLQAEVERLRGEVVNRNQRALDGDKATAAFNAEYERAEQHRIRAESAERKLAEAVAALSAIKTALIAGAQTVHEQIKAKQIAAQIDKVTK